MSPPPDLIETLRRARHVVVLTGAGAGASAESGIPTFRDALRGLWARFDAKALATPGLSTGTRTWSEAGTNGAA